MSLRNHYCVLKDVQRAALNHDRDDAKSFEDEIVNASRWVDEECKRDFLYHDHATELLTVEETWIGENRIVIPWPIRTLTAVFVDGVELAPSTYRAEPTKKTTYSGCIIRDQNWNSSKAGGLPTLIQLRGTFGYVPSTDENLPSPQLPTTVVKACAIAAVVFAGKFRKDVAGADGNRVSVAQNSVPNAVIATLKPLRWHSP